MQKLSITVLFLALGLLLALPGPVLAQPANADLAAKINAGYDLLEQGKFDQAQKIYEEILTKQPNHPIALNNLAALNCKQGKFAQALAQLNRALPQAKGYKITLNRVCNVDGVCAAFRQSTDRFGEDNLEDLIKSNILMVQMAAADRRPGK
ncbi:MAG: tetratricopeptide repeat protein [Deltaproteobacteria bacterium]|nr:tetratricopeptide repeat protein [Deltaproteobacteria bacterium]